MARRGLLLVLLALLALPLLSQTKYALVIGLGKQEDRAWPKINGDKDVPRVRQMLRKVVITEPGNTEFLWGDQVDKTTFDRINEQTIAQGGQPAAAKPVLLGITKAALATESFLSAASFQETSRVLTEAAIKNKVDPLYGLKENVIIGKQISAGTGLAEYRNVQIKEVVKRSDREQF